jgi:hypothetical protein
MHNVFSLVNARTPRKRAYALGLQRLLEPFNFHAFLTWFRADRTTFPEVVRLAYRTTFPEVVRLAYSFKFPGRGPCKRAGARSRQLEVTHGVSNLTRECAGMRGML